MSREVEKDINGNLVFTERCIDPDGDNITLTVVELYAVDGAPPPNPMPSWLTYTTEQAPLGTGETRRDVTIFAVEAGLTPDTTYTFRLVAKDQQSGPVEHFVDLVVADLPGSLLGKWAHMPHPSNVLSKVQLRDIETGAAAQTTNFDTSYTKLFGGGTAIFTNAEQDTILFAGELANGDKRYIELDVVTGATQVRGTRAPQAMSIGPSGKLYANEDDDLVVYDSIALNNRTVLATNEVDSGQFVEEVFVDPSENYLYWAEIDRGIDTAFVQRFPIGGSSKQLVWSEGGHNADVHMFPDFSNSKIWVRPGNYGETIAITLGGSVIQDYGRAIDEDTATFIVDPRGVNGIDPLIILTRQGFGDRLKGYTPDGAEIFGADPNRGLFVIPYYLDW